jgi:hypothetical protein
MKLHTLLKTNGESQDLGRDLTLTDINKIMGDSIDRWTVIPSSEYNPILRIGYALNSKDYNEVASNIANFKVYGDAMLVIETRKSQKVQSL